MTTTNVNPARRMMIILCLIMLFFAAVSMACEDGVTVQETGSGIVQDMLLEQTQMEQDVINLLQNQCAESVECAAHQLP